MMNLEHSFILHYCFILVKAKVNPKPLQEYTLDEIAVHHWES